MATIVQRGKAAVTGIAGTFDVIAYPVAQSGTFTQNFEEEIVKDVQGFDAAWLARNLHYLADFKFKVLGDTAANAAISGATATILQPYAVVTLTAFTLTAINGAYQNVSGLAFDLNNASVADFAVKLRKYSDATQNNAAIATPS